MRPSPLSPTPVALALLGTLAASAMHLDGPHARADHGGPAGVGASGTVTARTLPRGGFAFELREEVIWLDAPSVASLVGSMVRGQSALRAERLATTTAIVSVGLHDRVQVGLALPYVAVSNGAVVYGGTGAVRAFEADGLGDLWLSTKVAILPATGRALSVLAGLKLPTGRSTARVAEGAEVPPLVTPGSGALDFQLGVAFSQRLGATGRLDASGSYTWRTAAHGIALGDRVELGLTYGVYPVKRWRAFVELSSVTVLPAVESSDADAALGLSALRARSRPKHAGHDLAAAGTSTALLAGGGVRFEGHRSLGLWASVGVPVWQVAGPGQMRLGARVLAGCAFEI